MVTKFGKYLRVLRMDRGELLKDMADKLELVPSYLSSIENGKRTPANDIVNKIADVYSLSSEAYEGLLSAFEETVEEVKINLQNLSEEKVDLSVVFARRLNELSEKEIQAINKILKESR